jgi:hypothetical protein
LSPLSSSIDALLELANDDDAHCDGEASLIRRLPGPSPTPSPWSQQHRRKCRHHQLVFGNHPLQCRFFPEGTARHNSRLTATETLQRPGPPSSGSLIDA